MDPRMKKVVRRQREVGLETKKIVIDLFVVYGPECSGG